MVPGIIMIILFAAFNLDEYDGQIGYICLVIVSNILLKFVHFYFIKFSIKINF